MPDFGEHKGEHILYCSQSGGHGNERELLESGRKPTGATA